MATHPLPPHTQPPIVARWRTHDHAYKPEPPEPTAAESVAWTCSRLPVANQPLLDLSDLSPDAFDWLDFELSELAYDWEMEPEWSDWPERQQALEESYRRRALQLVERARRQP